jgi:hypothetical protein
MVQSFLNEGELYIPEDIIKEARSVVENLLPRKSVSLYEKEYNIFCACRKSRNIKGDFDGNKQQAVQRIVKDFQTNYLGAVALTSSKVGMSLTSTSSKAKMSLTRILSNVVEKCLKNAHLIFINNVIFGYFNSISILIKKE